MTREEIQTKVKGFVVERYLDGDDSELDADTPLFELGILDSISIHEFLTFIETEFHVQVEHGEVTAEKLESIRAVSILIERLVEGGQKAAG